MIKKEKGACIHKNKNNVQKKENSLEIATDYVKSLLQEKYPSLTFKIKKNYYLKDILIYNKSYKKLELRTPLNSTFIKTDGGYICV